MQNVDKTARLVLSLAFYMPLQPNKNSTLEQWVDWLSSLYSTEIDLGLDRIRKVAIDMDLRQPAPHVLTVAGTNGKGSSVAMLVASLKHAGYKVGSYTSPHILRFNERIQINQQPVVDRQITQAFAEIELARKQTKLTYFEFATLAALSIFKACRVDIAVLEVGLGGRLDAVNVVDADAALITAIDIDHVDWLGDDREKIAIEKAGVMRSGHLAVCSDDNPPKSLAEYAKHHQVDLLQLGTDFNYHGPIQFENTSVGWCWQTLSHNINQLVSSEGNQNFVLPRLKGLFQLQNAAGVVALLLELWVRKRLFLDFSWQQVVTVINQGLAHCVHPGRLQTLKVNQQSWLIDVAHNPQSAQVLVEFLQQSSTAQYSLTAIFSVLNDKDSLPMVELLAPFIKHWFIADLDNPRSMSIQDLQALLHRAGVVNSSTVTVEPMNSIAESVDKALNSSSDVLVFGSFFTVSQAFAKLKIQQIDIQLDAFDSSPPVNENRAIPAKTEKMSRSRNDSI